jgi:hypothetical protein
MGRECGEGVWMMEGGREWGGGRGKGEE